MARTECLGPQILDQRDNAMCPLIQNYLKTKVNNVQISTLTFLGMSRALDLPLLDIPSQLRRPLRIAASDSFHFLYIQSGRGTAHFLLLDMPETTQILVIFYGAKYANMCMCMCINVVPCPRGR